MHAGLYLPNFGTFGDARLLADLAHDAEQSGWDGFFIWDHVAWDRLPHVDPWVALSAIALRTDRIRIGTTVTPLPRRRPWQVARQAVSVDRLSGGRLTLGVGTGSGAAEWGDMGEETDPRTRGAMLDEALEILVGLWTGEPFRHSGVHYTLKETQFLPTPVQEPRIPIWVGGVWPNKRPFRRAALWDGAFPLFEAETEEAELTQLEEMLDYCHRHGSCRHVNPKAEWDVVSMGVTPDNDRATATEMIRQRAKRGATWWLECITPLRFGMSWADSWPLGDIRRVIHQGPLVPSS